MAIIDIFADMARQWGSPIVARDRIEKFSGGLLRPKTMANLDSRGEGPPRVKVGRKVGYPVEGLVQWMESRSTEGGG